MTWTGRKATRATEYVVARDAGRCHLCGHDGANSCDHLIPTSVRPDLEWTPSNWAAAHLFGAGSSGGCQTTGCHCPGNRGRQNAPVDVIKRVVAELNDGVDTAAPSRDW